VEVRERDGGAARGPGAEAPRGRPRREEGGHAYVIVDGTLIAIDRVAADKPFYSGKHKKHGMNLQVIASPQGDILWVSGALPGSVHDKKAEWIWGVLDELEKAGLITLADKGYRGSTWAKIPYRGKNKPAPQKQANRAHAKLRAPGERANAQLKTWRILRKLRCSPGAPGNSPRPSTLCNSARHNQGGISSVGRSNEPCGVQPSQSKVQWATGRPPQRHLNDP
jgi:hypothetical protein